MVQRGAQSAQKATEPHPAPQAATQPENALMGHRRRRRGHRYCSNSLAVTDWKPGSAARWAQRPEHSAEICQHTVRTRGGAL